MFTSENNFQSCMFGTKTTKMYCIPMLYNIKTLQIKYKYNVHNFSETCQMELIKMFTFLELPSLVYTVYWITSSKILTTNTSVSALPVEILKHNMHTNFQSKKLRRNMHRVLK